MNDRSATDVAAREAVTIGPIVKLFRAAVKPRVRQTLEWQGSERPLHV